VINVFKHLVIVNWNHHLIVLIGLKIFNDG